MAETKKSCQALRKDIIETSKLANAMQRSGNALRNYGIRLFPVIGQEESISRRLEINMELMAVEAFVSKMEDSLKFKERNVVECSKVMDKKWLVSFAGEMKNVSSQKTALERERLDASNKFSRL